MGCSSQTWSLPLSSPLLELILRRHRQRQETYTIWVRCQSNLFSHDTALFKNPMGEIWWNSFHVYNEVYIGIQDHFFFFFWGGHTHFWSVLPESPPALKTALGGGEGVMRSHKYSLAKINWRAKKKLPEFLHWWLFFWGGGGTMPPLPVCLWRCISNDYSLWLNYFHIYV